MKITTPRFIENNSLVRQGEVLTPSGWRKTSDHFADLRAQERQREAARQEERERIEYIKSQDRGFAFEDGRNPWSERGKNLTRQMAALRANVEAADRLRDDAIRALRERRQVRPREEREADLRACGLL